MIGALPLNDVPVGLPEPELLKVTALAVVAPPGEAQEKDAPFQVRNVLATVGAVTKPVALAPVWYTNWLEVPLATFVAFVAFVTAVEPITPTTCAADAAVKALVPLPYSRPFKELAPVPPLGTVKLPVTPVAKGSPVAFVSTAADGVPRLGVTNVGETM